MHDMENTSEKDTSQYTPRLTIALWVVGARPIIHIEYYITSY